MRTGTYHNLIGVSEKHKTVGILYVDIQFAYLEKHKNNAEINNNIHVHHPLIRELDRVELYLHDQCFNTLFYHSE